MCDADALARAMSGLPLVGVTDETRDADPLAGLGGDRPDGFVVVVVHRSEVARLLA